MNICFVLGNIIEKINFKFVLNGKNDSISNFKVKLLNDSVISIIAYNEIADYCYRELKINDVIFIQGKLNLKLEIVAEKIIIWKKWRKGWINVYNEMYTSEIDGGKNERKKKK